MEPEEIVLVLGQRTDSMDDVESIIEKQDIKRQERRKNDPYREQKRFKNGI